jgi:hypothetical protein
MDIALIIIIAVLFALVAVIILKGRRGRQAALEHEQGEARVTAEKGKAQQERSSARQADVRAASAERASEAGSDSDE